MNKRRISRARNLACTVLALAGATLAHAATFTVTTTAETGPGSLRQAITDANADNLSPRIIAFNIPGPGPQTITLASALPEITRTTTVDGTTQPGYAGVPLIVINGNSLDADGLVVNAFPEGSAGPVLKALCIVNFGANGGTARHGVVLRQGDAAQVTGCFVGIDAAGTAAARNTGAGIRVENFPNTIGGTVASDRNVISGNLGPGIEIAGPQNTVRGNFIGTRADGLGPLGNGSDGVFVSAGGQVMIGGNVDGAGNVIAGNTGHGIRTRGATTRVLGNLIGLLADGTTAAGNAGHGVFLENGTSAVIGANTLPERNVISASGGVGVRIEGATGSDSSITNNYIGTDASGTLARGNMTGGVHVVTDGASVSRNVISANGGSGVLIESGAGGVNTNKIGVNADATAKLGNNGDGIRVVNVLTGNLNANTIGGNSGAGILLTGANCHDMFVLGNAIGTDPAGSINLGNTGDGLLITGGAQDEIVGARNLTTTSERNIIAFNGGNGVTFEVRNNIGVNSIHSNVGLALDRGGDGIDAPALRGTGTKSVRPEQNQGGRVNAPTITDAITDPTNQTIVIGFEFRQAALAGARIDIEFYSNDPGKRELKRVIGKITDTTVGPDGQIIGRVPFTALVTVGEAITAKVVTRPNTPDKPCSSEVGPPVAATDGSEPPGVKSNTTANHIFSGKDIDPVDTFSGELFEVESTDLSLGGPFPLFFARYYASRIADDGNLSSPLGRNRSHNFDAKLTISGNDAKVTLNNGRVVQFTKANNAWSLSGRQDIPFQLVDTPPNLILGDPRTQQRWTFDATGKPVLIEDGRGNAHTLTYDGSGRLASVGDGLGRGLIFTYDATGRLTLLRDGARNVSFVYTGSDLTSVTDPLNQTVTYNYDGSGRLLGTTRPRGNTPVTRTYDGSSRVATQTEHPGGANFTTALNYDTNARTTTLTDPAGNTRIHTHTATAELSNFTDESGKSIVIASDNVGRRSSITDRLGRVTTITYHSPSGKPATYTAADGAVTTFDYTARTSGGLTFFDLTKITLPDGSTQNFTYDANGNLLTATDPLGAVSAYTYNGRGQRLTETNPTGGVTTYTYDGAGNLATAQDSDTAATSYVYDNFSRLTRVTYPDGAHFDFAYDAADRLTSITDERAKSYTFTYDANDNLTSITDPATATSQFTYDELDRVTRFISRMGKMRSRTFDPRDLLASETDELNHTTTIVHDARQRVSGVTDPANATVTFGYDDEGGLTSVTDSLGNSTTLVRNARGRVVGIANPLGQTVQLERDSLQRVTKVSDELGRNTTFSYDARGLLSGTSRDGAGAASYSYDAHGNLTRTTDPRSNHWNYTYTTTGLLTSIQDPLNRTTGFIYDNLARLVSMSLPEGGNCSIERDAADNITRLLFPDGTDLQYGYDALDRVITANGVAYTRDAEGRITASQHPGGVNFGATYDDAGRLTSASYNNGALVVTYAYDVNDRLINVSDNLSGAGVAFTYDVAGRLVSVTRSNGANSTFTHDAADRLTRIQDGTFLDLQYTLNAAGEVVSTDFTAPLTPTIAADTKQFTYNPANEISSPGYTYDARGRLTASPGHTFTWDAASRLRSLDGTTLTYDGLGDVATRTVAGTTTRFFHLAAIAGHPLVAERNEGTNQFSRFYVWTPDGTLLYAIDSATNAPSFYHYDRIGSTLALTDAAGSVTDAYAYSPYGENLGRTGTSDQPFTFVGALGVRSEGSLFQMRARYYDPLTARFLSRDPASPRLSDVRTLDPYVYALGNPLNYVDRNGTESALADHIVSYAVGIIFIEAFGLEDILSEDERENARKFIETSVDVALNRSDDDEVDVVPPVFDAVTENVRLVLPSKSGQLAKDALGDFGDLSVVAKYALLNDRSAGNFVSGGLSVTVPTSADSLVTQQQNQVSTTRGDKVEGPKSKGPLKLFKKFVKKALAAQAAQAQADAQAKEKAAKQKAKADAKAAKKAEKEKAKADAENNKKAIESEKKKYGIDDK